MRSYKNGKLTRTDHRAANPNSVTRRDRVRNPVGRKTIEQEHDQQGRFSRSIKANYIDSDGDGLKDMYLRANRSPATAKPDYRNLGTPPAPVIPVDLPIEGPDSLTTELLAPAVGPGSLDASLQPPVAGPGSLVAEQPPFNTKSISFDGANDYMGSLPIDRLNGATWSNTTPVSQSAWVKVNSFTADDAVFGIGKFSVNGSYNPSFVGGNSGLHMSSSGFYLWQSGTRHNLSGTFSTGVWYHIVWTWDGTNGVVYVNGSSNITFTDNSNGFATRMCLFAGGGGRWNGYAHCLVDEVTFWDSSLSSGDVTTLYNSGAPGDPLPLSPLVWYRMGDGTEAGSGTDIYDMSGNSSANAKLFNGASFSADVPTIPAWNGNTYSVDFDGSDDYMDCGAVSALNSTSSFTISMWLNFEHVTGGVVMSAFTSGTSTSNRVEFVFNNVNELRFGVDGSVNNCALNISSPTDYRSTNAWHNILGTYDGTNVTLFFDGSQVATTTTSVPSTTSSTQGNDTTIGRRNYGGGIHFNGLVDEAAIWDYELSASDITAIYNSGTPNDISSLSPVHWWRMGDNNGGTGTTVTDQGSGGNDGTLTNGPTFSTDIPTLPQPPMSLSFDGTDDLATLSDTGIGVDSQSAYTFSCWVKLDSYYSNSGFFTVDGGNSIDDWTHNNWWRIESSGNSLAWYHSITAASYKIVSGSLSGAGLSPFATDTWYHIMCTWSGSELKSYVNGTLIGTLTGVTEWRGRPGKNFAINIGRNRFSYMDGNIDEWAWLPTDESDNISAIYNNGSPTDLSSYSPLFYYRMGEDDGGTGSIVTNLGSETGNLTLTNGQTFSTDVPT